MVPMQSISLESHTHTWCSSSNRNAIIILIMLKKNMSKLVCKYTHTRAYIYVFTHVLWTDALVNKCVCGVCNTNSVSIGKHKRQLSLRWACQTAPQSTKRGTQLCRTESPKKNNCRAKAGSNSAELKARNWAIAAQKLPTEMPGP